MPQQKLYEQSGAAKQLESDDASEAEEAYDLKIGSDSDSGEVHDSGSGEADELLTGQNNKAQQGTASSPSSLEERRAGIPAETSGQPGATPGKSSLFSSPLIRSCCALSFGR